MKEMCLMLYLSLGAWMDGRKKKISSGFLAAGFSLGGMFWLADLSAREPSLIQGALRLLPGILFLLYGRLTKEKIGYGDGLLLLVLGVWLDAPELWRVWCLGIWLHFGTVLVLFLAKKIRKEEGVPFLPFLCLSFGVVWGINYAAG